MAEITIGDLFWDKDHAWTDGSQDLDMVNLVLSADQEDGERHYRVGTFMWCGSGYCGAHDRKFTAGEVLKMTKVGNIAEIKSFVKTENTND